MPLNLKTTKSKGKGDITWEDHCMCNKRPKTIAINRSRRVTSEPPYDIIPLANPKGVSFKCEVCQSEAYYLCKKCRWCTYCSMQCMDFDMATIHPAVCHIIAIINAPIPHIDNKSGRERLKAELKHKTNELIHITCQMAKQSIQDGTPMNAVLQISYCLRFVNRIYKRDDWKIIPYTLVLAEAFASANKMREAKDSLQKARWVMDNNSGCKNSVRANFYGTKGFISVSEKEYEQAKESYSEEIFYATEAYHPEHQRTATGYFHLGTVFLSLKAEIIAHSLFMHTVEIWYNTIQDVFLQMISQDGPSFIQTRKDMEESKNIRLSQDELNEAKSSLTFIYNDASQRLLSEIPQSDVIKICYTLSMYYYLTGDYHTGLLFAEKGKIIVSRIKTDMELSESSVVISAHQQALVVQLADKLKVVKKHLTRQISRQEKNKNNDSSLP